MQHAFKMLAAAIVIGTTALFTTPANAAPFSIANPLSVNDLETHVQEARYRGRYRWRRRGFRRFRLRFYRPYRYRRYRRYYYPRYYGYVPNYYRHRHYRYRGYRYRGYGHRRYGRRYYHRRHRREDNSR
ncbi:MAG: hypothetical protein ACR2O4_10420 [Hyphomicrobiaceae bacterium]